MVYGDGQECSLRLTSTTVSGPLLYVHQCLSTTATCTATTGVLAIRYLDTTSGTGHNVNHVVESQMFKGLNRLDILQGQ